MNSRQTSKTHPSSAIRMHVKGPVGHVVLGAHVTLQALPEDERSADGATHLDTLDGLALALRLMTNVKVAAAGGAVAASNLMVPQPRLCPELLAAEITSMLEQEKYSS